MIITDIIEISAKQCKIMIDEEFAFVLYKGELRKYGMQKGHLIEEALYRRLIEEVLMKRAKLRAMNLLKSRAYTEKKLRDKLRGGQYPESCIDEAIHYVKSYGYIDDEQYAADYLFYHGKSMNRKQVLLKLRERGISEEVSRSAYEAFCADGMAPDETELVCRLLAKRNYIPQEDDRSRRDKTIRYLQQKGFSYDRIMSAFAVYGKNDE